MQEFGLAPVVLLLGSHMLPPPPAPPTPTPTPTPTLQFLLAHLRASHESLPPEWSSYILPFTLTKKQQKQQQQLSS